MTNGLTRRTVFRRLASFGALCGLTALALPVAAMPPRVAAWGRSLPGGAAVRSVGRGCLAAGVVEDNLSDLADALDVAIRRKGTDPRGGQPLQEALADVRKKEFAAGDVVRVDGWVLSRSEARAYALVALCPPLDKEPYHT